MRTSAIFSVSLRQRPRDDDVARRRAEVAGAADLIERILLALVAERLLGVVQERDGAPGLVAELEPRARELRGLARLFGSPTITRVRLSRRTTSASTA
jgi:hypothetical protein